MNFLSPLRLLLLLGLPLIILIYLKKQQKVEVKVPSIALWDKVIKEVEGVKRNKLSRYILLFLQILIGALIIIAFASPIKMINTEGNQVTIAIDGSISMEAKENGVSHFNMAKEKIIDYINNMPKGKKINIVLLKNKCEILGQNLSEKEAENVIKAAKVTNEPLNFQSAIQILSGLNKERIVVTNKDILLGDRVLKIGGKIDNLGIVKGRYDLYSSSVYCRVKNYGKSKINTSVLVKGENGYKDIQKVEISSGEEVDIKWSNIPKEAEMITFSIDSDDSISEDNKYLLPIGNKYKNNVVLVGENYFLEQALKSLQYINLDVKKQWKDVDKKYDFYVIDNNISVNLPEDANAWWIKVPENMIDSKVSENKKLNILKGRLTENINKLDLTCSGAYTLKSEKGDENIITIDDKALMLSRVYKNKKSIYSSLDFNKSNLVLTPAFPILVDNILKWSLEDNKINLDNPSIFTVNDEYKDKISDFKVKAPQMELKNIFIIISLVLLVVEWEVFKRGY